MIAVNSVLYFFIYLILNKFIKVNGILGAFIFKLDMSDSVTTLGLGRKKGMKKNKQKK